MTYLEKAGADLILPPFFHFLHHLKGDFLYDYVFSGSVFAGRRLLPMADWLNGFPGSMIGKHPLSLIPMALTTFL